MTMKVLRRVLLTYCLLLGTAYAQTVGASLQGTVYDQSGAFVPNVTIEIRSVDKGTLHTVTTDDRGRFREPLLLPGTYELEATAPGFQPLVMKDIQLTVGQDAVLDVKLAIQATTGQVTVTAEQPAINLASAALSGTVERKQMNELPLNGRSFQQLALLQPGVNFAAAAGNDVVGGRGQKITINGARPENSSFLLDGSDINNVYNKTPGSVGGVLLGVEAVQEFQVLTNAYSAEFGRSSGGIINAITRSGQNQVHGNLFEYLRNSALDAKNFFDPADRPIPPFKRNQFGGTLGGPIRRDKTFFFGAFEAIRERLGFTGVTNVPDDNARNGILPGQKPLSVNPASAQLLTLLFPLANGPNKGNGIAQYFFTVPQPTNEYFAQGRIDHRFSEKDSFFGRYTFDNGKVNRQINNKTPVDFTKERSRNQYLTLEHQHIFSPLLLNTLRVSYSRSTSEADNQRTVDVPSQLWFVPGTQFGFFTIQGVVTEEGGDYRLPRNDHLNNYQWHDALFWTKGGHGFRFGTEGQRMQFNQNTSSQIGGIETFTSLANFLTGTPSQLNFAVPGRIDPNRGFRESLFAFFIQDDFRWRPNFTLNLGLRYEFATVPAEQNGKISNLRQVSDQRLTIGSPWHSNPSLKDFAPRIGLAWDPFKNGKTSVRAGFGIFDDQILPKSYVFSGSLNPPFTTRTSIPSPKFPNGLQTFDVTQPICPSTLPCFKANLQTVNFDLQPAYIMQYNLSVQRALPGDWTITIGYAGSHGLHLMEVAESNLAPTVIVNGVQQYCPSTAVAPLNPNCTQNGRRNTSFGGIAQRKSDAQSFYNALQVGAVRQFSHGFRAQFSYTFARSIDDASGINSQDFDNSTQYAIDFYNRQADRGLSSFWSKHVFVANWGYEFPFGGNKKGLAGALLKGWQLNGINTVQSGTPFEPRLGFDRSGNMNTIDFSMHERPSLAPGASNNPVIGDPAHWFDANAFVLPALYTIGNLGRNTIIGPKLVDFDFSLFKEFTVGENKTLDFRTEVFNIFNHPNFAVPNQANRTIPFPQTVPGTTVPSPAGTPPSGPAGAITTTVTTSRQIQFGLKFTF
jgi:outer membrane receptor protein involved in Fe transport